MAKYVVLHDVANWKEGDILEYEVLPVALQSHVKESKSKAKGINKPKLGKEKPKADA